jgi:hypothetical protein
VKSFFFHILVQDDCPEAQGKKVAGNCRILAKDATEARRRLIGYVADKCKLEIPPHATDEEKVHIERYWPRLRVVSIENSVSEDLKRAGVPDDLPCYFWGWDELPSEEV